MPTLPIPDHEMLKTWLEQHDIEFYLCGSCDGLHLPQLHDVSGIYDAKVEIEGDFLYCTASIELRPASVMAVNAELSHLNTYYPTLKIFLEMLDETLPRLIISHNLALRSGVEQNQFIYFVQDCIEQIGQLAADVKNMGVIYNSEMDEIEAPEFAMMH